MEVVRTVEHDLLEKFAGLLVEFRDNLTELLYRDRIEVANEAWSISSCVWFTMR